MEQQSLYDTVDKNLAVWNQPIRSTVLRALLCPSDAGFGAKPSDTQGMSITNYIASEGYHWWPNAAIPNYSFAPGCDFQGVFGGGQATNMAKITDGTSMTILLAENYSTSYKAIAGSPWWASGVGVPRLPTGEAVFRPAFVWAGYAGTCCETGWWSKPDDSGTQGAGWWKASPHAFTPSFILAWGLNAEWPGAGSIHPGVEQVVQADGSVHALSTSITYEVWCKLNAMKDGEALDTTVLK
jgi:hypothetical protein